MDAIKSIDALYEEVRDYDIVLCNDAPLTTALNNRVDKAMLGHFAVTPRQFAASHAVESTGHPIIDDIRLVKTVADDTGYGLRYVHGEIQSFMTASRYTNEPRLGRKSKIVWDFYGRCNTLDRVMREIGGFARDYFKGKRVAVIGLDLFDELDKQVLPEDFDEIDIIDHDSDFTIPEMRVLGNDRQIAECAADIARQCGPNDVAIVMDTGGPMADAVKSALYRIEMPFINSLNVRDLATVRNFLEFVQLALNYETIKVRDVRELISAYGGRIYSKYDMYYLSKFRLSGIKRSERTDELLDIMSAIREKCFKDVCTACVPPGDRPSVTMLLDQMDCLKDKDYVNQDTLDDLVYAVNSITTLSHNEQLSDNEKAGVLLVDCKNSVYIDRPVVVYTGMCSEWEVDLSDLDYIDPKKRPDIEDKNVLRFKALIQQGSVRFYLVNATKGGEEAVPCKYFDSCIRKKYYDWETPAPDEDSEPITRFEQVAGKLVCGPWAVEKRDRSEKSGEEFLEAEPPPQVFSKTSYTAFLECPRQYMLSRLAGSPDSNKTFTGNRIHEYAEFRVAYPDIAKENGPEFYADMIADECAPLNSPDLEGIERSRIVAEARAIDAFIDAIGAGPGKLVPRSSEKKEPNMFMEYHGLELVSENCELSLSSKDGAIHGIIDLLWNGVIYDYKTGWPLGSSDLAKKYNIFDLRFGKVVDDHRDAQALLYLALLEECGIPNDKLFKLFYPQQWYKLLLNGEDADVQSCIRSMELIETDREAVDKYGSGLLSADKYSKYVMLTPLSVYDEAVSEWGTDCGSWGYNVNNPANNPALDAIGQRLGVVGTKGQVTKTSRGDIAMAVKKVHDFLMSTFINPGDGVSIAVSRDTIERFKVDLKEDMERLHGYYREGFPTIPAIKCEDCAYRDMCVCEVEGGEDDDGSE